MSRICTARQRRELVRWLQLAFVCMAASAAGGFVAGVLQ